MNDPPLISRPTASRAIGISGLSVDDADLPEGELTVTLRVGGGSLNVDPMRRA